jgi:hypothetical protein
VLSWSKRTNVVLFCRLLFDSHHLASVYEDYECGIFGDITVKEAIKIVDSIYER